MKISVNTIRFLNKVYSSAGDPAPNGVDDLVQKIGAQLGGVEETVAFGERYDGVLIVTVVSCNDHPNADRLHVCKIDDGGRAKNVERDENGHVQVVCGAPNVRAGITVAWLPPGSTVPSTFDKDPFVLEARELRGVVSNGMLASAKELGLGDNHEGILEIEAEVEPGTPFSEKYNLHGDVIIDMENKMFTHRPDCFGWLGIAREIAGIYQQSYKSPNWYQLNPEFPGVEAEELKLEVRNELPELVPRFTAIAMRDVTIKQSPVWLQVQLARVGLRPINNIVDYTNFFMLMTGQPLHAYDYDKVKTLSEADHAVIVVRKPHEGEKINLLSGKAIEPRSDAIMIATDRQLIGVGGVMGGADTEVDENTKNIILECGNFDMYSIRRTAMAHGLFTDAVTRFNKGQSPLQNLAVLAKIVDEIRKYADGKIAGQLIDDNHLPEEVMQRGSLYAPITSTPEFINERLGLNLSAEEMRTLLTNVEFKIELQSSSEHPTSNIQLLINAPFWRTDIEIKEDIVEEIGRLYGYDHLPLDLPKRDIAPAEKDPLFELKAKVRAALAKAGANEVLTYSFVHGNLLDKVGQDRAQAFQLSNALSPDLQYYRLSLTPSLLEKIHPNIKAGYDKFALFELGKAHIRDDDTRDTVPDELERIALVFAADSKAAQHYEGAAYYQARKYLMEVLRICGIADQVIIEPLHPEHYIGITQAKIPQYEAGRAAIIRLGNVCVGEIGEYKSSVQKSLKLPAFCAGFELDLLVLGGLLDGILPERDETSRYAPMPKFPKIEQDICLKVAADLPYTKLYDFVAAEIDKVKPEHASAKLSPVDIYQREDDQTHKQITVRLSIASLEKTLRDEEVNKLLDGVAHAAQTTFGAERI